MESSEKSQFDCSEGIILQLDTDHISPELQSRVAFWLGRLNCNFTLAGSGEASFPGTTPVVAAGNTSFVLKSLPSLAPVEAAKLAVPESFLLFAPARASGGAAAAVFARDELGLAFGLFRLLEDMGCFFFHPLAPSVPATAAFAPLGALPLVSAPALAVRGLHYHTQHPLELTELLNGFDSGGERWEDMLGEFRLLCDWMLANGLNSLEWVLLYADDWHGFAWSATRQKRLARLAAVAHGHGLRVGADVGIAEEQQHGWPLVQNVTDAADERRQIRRHLDWLFAEDGANFDYLSTESGFSEFTKPQCHTMLRWMNETTTYLAETYGKPAFIKCHCSRGQTCPDYDNVDFNLLPQFADPRLGVYPHTVQFYNFSEPAPVYGNTNFSYMENFAKKVAPARATVYHGETAYWVNVDIDVPLFLPLYAAGRLEDLQALRAGAPSLLGSVTFDSGWEWGYWLSDVLVARGTWAGAARVGGPELAPLLGRAFGPRFVGWLEALVATQRRLLVYGEAAAAAPPPAFPQLQNGMAYVVGVDTWVELMALAGKDLSTQPQRVDLTTAALFRDSPSVRWDARLRPLLRTMAAELGAAAAAAADLAADAADDAAAPLLEEIRDAANATYLRALTVGQLYEFAVEGNGSALRIAQHAIRQMQDVVRRREAAYRVPLPRIAGWRENPTAYHYGYLWTVHSLFYSWRDYARATMFDFEAVVSPCFMNIDDPADIALGEGIVDDLVQWIHNLTDSGVLKDVADCLGIPKTEPNYNYF